jgi:hypothetical protein
LGCVTKPFLGAYTKKGRIIADAASRIIPAVTYSPTQLPMQYHRR